MGTRIEAVATATHRGWLFGRGALHLSDAAARTCLRRGHHRAGELDILVNAGLYKDHNLAEPALASIIQEDIGANPGHPPRRDHHGTFSFDVLNDGCGVLTAAQVIDGWVGPGSAQLGMIVAADADPSPRTTHGFPWVPAGGALLLAHDDDAPGFRGFAVRTFAEHASLFEAHLRWISDAGVVRPGRNVLEIREAPAFATMCIAHAVAVTVAFLDEIGLRPGDVDVLVASPYPRHFAASVAGGLGIPDDRVPRVRRELATAHTAGPIAALEASIDAGQFALARNILFVTAGAGITISAALYQRAPGN